VNGRASKSSDNNFKGIAEMARKEIRSEISGTVISVLVKVGDTISVGDELGFIEAMKMEIPLTAPFSGKVIEVRIAESDAIAENDLSFVLEG
jgi:biotin carboxyl carrier protein